MSSESRVGSAPVPSSSPAGDGSSGSGTRDRTSWLMDPLRRAFLRGLAALLPLVLTVAIVVWVAHFVYRYVAVPMSALVEIILKRATAAHYHPVIEEVFQEWSVKALGFFLAVILVMLVGALVFPAVGRRIVAWLEGSLERVPLIKLIYPRVKQLIEFLFSKPRIREFRQVVAVEYPRKGLYSLGFITSQGLRELDEKGGDHRVTVFVPSSPTPLTGYVLFARTSELIHLSLTPEEAFPLLISGGVIVPRGHGTGSGGETQAEMEG